MTTPKIYNNIDEVLKLYPTIYYENDRTKNSKLQKFKDTLYVSPNVFDSVWEQSYKAAQATLYYLSILGMSFGIKVYVAVFEKGKLKHFVKYIQTPTETVAEHYRNLGSNLSNILDKKSKFRQDELNTLKHTKLELMNCILQDKPESDEKHQYHSLLERLCAKKFIPDGMYIFSLRDTLLLRRDGKHPFIGFGIAEERTRFPGYEAYGKDQRSEAKNAVKNPKSCDNNWEKEGVKFLPIFNTTGGVDYYDIPIVEYESLNYINDITFRYENKYEFVNKDFKSKIPKAIFRGSATGCGYDEENVRLHLAKLAAEKSNEVSKFLDIGITAGKRKFIYSYEGKIGVLDLYSYLKKYNIKIGNRMTKPQQSDYKYILVAEGNVSAHRIASDLLLHSVMLLIDSMYTVWCSHLMIPYVHYIPIKADLSDLGSQLKYCEANPELMESIARESYDLGKKLMTYKTLEINIIDSLRLV
jgi:hypothetical protein